MALPLSARKSTFDSIFQEPLPARKHTDKPVMKEKHSRTHSAATQDTVLITENPRFQMEHCKRVYDDWQKIKEDAKEEGREKLETKVALQHELIQAQDELATERRKEELERKNKKLEAEKALRKAKVDAVLETSRKSIERRRVTNIGNVRTTQGGQHRAASTDNAPLAHDSKIHDSNIADDLSNEQPDSETDTRDGEFLATRGKDSKDAVQRSLGKKPVNGNADSQTSKTSGDEEDCDDEVTKDLPLYQVQLYDLYGPEADNYINPKFTDRTLARPLQQTGFMDAKTLWSSLRKESGKKIQDAERNLPNDLKISYNAFIREFVSDKENSRDFYTAKHVPDIAYLMDESRLMKTYAYHHKTQLMFRSSHKNEDSTRVLLFNNPIPDINNHNGDDGVMRFIATTESENNSIEDTAHGNETSCEPYLAVQCTKPTANQEVAKRQINDIRVFDLTEIEQRKSETGAPIQCVFLSKEMSQTPGAFSKKKRELLVAQHQDDMYSHRRDVTRKLSPTDRPTASGSGKCQKSVANSQKLRSRLERKLPAWEPLTLTALLEYSNKIPAPGRGAFSAGNSQSWVVTN